MLRCCSDIGSARALDSGIERDGQMASATTLKAIRLTHNYIGVFFAPTILFFAITGGLQMFSMHETTRGSAYVPPPLLVHLSQLHKKGTLYMAPKKPAPLAAPRAEAPKPEDPKPFPHPADPQPPNPLPTKLFFAATALALLLSTCTGLTMAWTYARRKLMVAGVFLAGVVVPLVLLLF